ESYQRFSDLWEEEGRENEPLHDATLATRLPSFLYPDTLGLAVKVKTEPVGERPTVMVTAQHPIAAEQKNGIPQKKLEEIWAKLLHQDDDEEDDEEDED